MFVPQSAVAQEWLRRKTDPPRSVRWQPAQSFVACDGKSAINVGPWQRPDGSFGYFTTVWIYEDQYIAGPRWVWVYDAGDTLKKPMKAPRKPLVRRASCKGIPTVPDDRARYSIATVPPLHRVPQEAKLQSRDRSFRYDWAVDPSGARRFKAWLWNGRSFEQVLDQQVAAPSK
jgi:hypothetical protein